MMRRLLELWMMDLLQCWSDFRTQGCCGFRKISSRTYGFSLSPLSLWRCWWTFYPCFLGFCCNVEATDGLRDVGEYLFSVIFMDYLSLFYRISLQCWGVWRGQERWSVLHSFLLELLSLSPFHFGAVDGHLVLVSRISLQCWRDCWSQGRWKTPFS